MPELSDEEKRRTAATTPVPAGGPRGPVTTPPDNPVVPPVLASGGEVSPEVEAARIANARHLAEGQRPNNELTMAQREERAKLADALAASRETLADPKARISSEDRGFVDESTETGQRNLRRASDPDKGLGSSTIDEARAMDLAERTGQLSGLVDRSGAPKADVKTTEVDDAGEVVNETNFQMKSVRADDPRQLKKSTQRAVDGIKELADMRAGGAPSPEFLADLKGIKDEKQLATIEATLQAQLVSQNERIAGRARGSRPSK